MARFVELGGKVMDTAMIYGTSEAVIGELAQDLGIRDRLFYATKTDIRGQLRGEAGWQQAMTRMKTDKIDAMLVHNIVNADTELPVMRDWQQQGKLRYIGASISTQDQFDQMERFMRDDVGSVLSEVHRLAPGGDRRDPGHTPGRARQRQLRRGVRPFARRGAAAAAGRVLRLDLLKRCPWYGFG